VCCVGLFMIMAIIQKHVLCTCVCSHGFLSASHFGDFISGEWKECVSSVVLLIVKRRFPTEAFQSISCYFKSV
jgi:hypothetical protein